MKKNVGDRISITLESIGVTLSVAEVYESIENDDTVRFSA